MACEYLNLHVGKLSQDLSTKVTLRLEAAFCEKARASGYAASQVLRELIHEYVAGYTFTEAQGKDIRASFPSEALSKTLLRDFE